MKHYIDIENLREQDIDLGNGMIRKRNCDAFEVGDIISLTEKIDGSCASISYNSETGKLDCFSRKQELNFGNTLEGFWLYVQSLKPEGFASTPNWVIFGEWLRKNKITYDKANMHKWYVYSIYDKATEEWLTQDTVKVFCKMHKLEYVHELYYGPFISWEHCKSFMNSPAYGDRAEGVVVRNQSKLNSEDNHMPFILKLVNDDFKETMIKSAKVVDPDVEAAKARAEELLSGIVTEARVSKMLLKLRDEGVLPSELSPKDMGTVAKHLPKRIYEDCLKEEPEIVMSCGEYAGKTMNTLAMRIARTIIVG